MKHRCYVFAVLLSIFIADNAIAQDHRFGIGFIVGEPTGLSAKLWTSQYNAFDFGFGWNNVENRNESGTRAHFHMDYLWHSFNAIRSVEQFPLYYGVGGRLGSTVDNSTSLAVRGVFGIAWIPRQTPLDIFLEIVPSIELVPSSDFILDAGIGMRYFF